MSAQSEHRMVEISYEEFLEYQHLKIDQDYLDVKDEIKMTAIAEKVVAILSDRGLVITERQAQEYQQLRNLRDNDELLSGTEVARIMGCSSATVTRLAARNKLEYTRVGKVNKYSRNGVYRYLKKRRVEAIVTPIV